MSGSVSKDGPLPQAVAHIDQILKAANLAATNGHEDHELSCLEDMLKAAQTGIEELRQAPQQSAELMDSAAMSLYQLSRGDLALVAVHYALSLSPNYVSALHHKAVILISMNMDVGLALQLLDQALSYSPHDKAVWASKGDALKVIGRSQEAIDCYLQAQQLDPTSTQYVDRALKIAPGNPRALQLKLSVAIQVGGSAAAISTCEQLIAGNPNDANLHFTMANLLTSIGKQDLALKALDNALTLSPDNGTYLFFRARILREMENYPEALGLYRSLLEKKATVDAMTLLELAQALEKKAIDNDLLLKVRLRILEVDPRNLANIQSLNSLASSVGDRATSIRACEAWLALSPHNIEAERSLASLYAANGDAEKAMSIYEDIARSHPNEIQEIRKGLTYAHDRKLDSRVVEFAHVIEAKEPGDVMTLEWLQASLSQLNRWPEALKAANDLLAISPENVGYLRLKKNCLHQLGQLQDIPSIIDKIFEIDPAAYDIAMERARMYQHWAEHSTADGALKERWAREALRGYERASISPEMLSDSLLGLAKTFKLVKETERAEQSYQRFLDLPQNSQRSDIWKDRGHALREMGRYSEAMECYQKALQLGCEDSDLLWGMAEALRSLNQEMRALHYLEILVKREPHNPLFLRRHGRLLMRTDKKEEGLSELRSALTLQERDPTACFELADALKETGAYQDAMTTYQRGLQLDPHNQAALLSLSEMLMLTGHLPEAIQHIDAILRGDSANMRAWRLRLDAYKALNKDQEVLYSLKAILLLSPEDAQAWEEKYRLHLTRGEKKDAYDSISSLVTSSATKPNLGDLNLRKGDLASDLGNLDEALTCYDEAAKSNPALVPMAKYRKAKAESTHGQNQEALGTLEEFGNPPFPKEVDASLAREILALRGIISYKLEHFDEALSLFDGLSKAEPDNVDLAAWKAQSLLALGKHQEAKDFLRGGILSIPSRSSELYLCLAEAEAGLGTLDGAVEACQGGLAVDATNTDLLLRLGDVKSKQEKWQDAVDAYARAIAADRGNAEAHLKMGMVNEKLGHPHEAIKAYEEATRLAPGNARAHLNLGLALLDAGRPDEALVSIEAALKADPELDAATEAKGVALQKIRERQIENFAKKGLFLSAQTNRPVSRNDLFMTIKVPWELLDPVTREIYKVVEIDVAKLGDKERMDLEGMSYHVITQALVRHLPSVDRGTITQADIALLAPPEYSLAQIQKLFGYIQNVMSATLKPETLKLTPEIEEKARRALAFSQEERTPFNLMKNLRIGIYEAMVIKAVETMTMDSRTQMPSVDVSRAMPPRSPPMPSPRGPEAPSPSAPSYAPPEPEKEETPLTDAPQGARCSGCGGTATYTHTCGANICRHCIVEYSNCPKCGLPLSLPEDGEKELPPEKHVAMDVPLALLPASKRVEDQERGGSVEGSSDTSRVRRLLRRSQSRNRSPSSSDPEDHL